MKAVILAAGKGKRLGTISQKIPKPMIEIRGRPVLEHNILMCKRNGIKEIFINLHHLPHVIKNYFNDGTKWGVNINYSIEPRILGTAGAVKQFQKHLNKSSFFVIYGDNYYYFDLDLLAEFHKKKFSDFSIALFWLDNVSQSGVVELTVDNRIKRFIEKPTKDESNSYWVNGGIYLIEPIILNEIRNGYADFGHNIIPSLITNGFNVFGYKMEKKVLAIDTPELLNKVRLKLGE